MAGRRANSITLVASPTPVRGRISSTFPHRQILLQEGPSNDIASPNQWWGRTSNDRIAHPRCTAQGQRSASATLWIDPTAPSLFRDALVFSEERQIKVDDLSRLGEPMQAAGRVVISES